MKTASEWVRFSAFFCTLTALWLLLSSGRSRFFLFSHIVGYQNIEVKPGYHLFTVTFGDVSGSEIDAQDVIPYDAEGTEIGPNNQIILNKMDGEGTYLTSYNYRKGKGWCKTATVQSRGTITFKDGEAVCLNNKTGANIYLRVSGQVNLNPTSMEIPAGFTLLGNMTPVTLDAQDVIPYDAEGTEIGPNNQIILNKMDGEGTYLTSYNYRKGKGWCKTATVQSRGTITFEPGESFCLNNKTGAPIVLKYKSPVQE